MKIFLIKKKHFGKYLLYFTQILKTNILTNFSLASDRFFFSYLDFKFQEARNKFTEVIIVINYTFQKICI